MDRGAANGSDDHRRLRTPEYCRHRAGKLTSITAVRASLVVPRPIEAEAVLKFLG
jgi:hypothetical protein